MSAPAPISRDYNPGMRKHTAYDLEEKLVAFITQLVSPFRLDNPYVNIAQRTQPAQPIVVDPDTVAPYDPTERGTTLLAKRVPQVVRGRVPRTVTGDIDPNQLPDAPHIIVQAVSAKVETLETHVTVRILIATYDENPDGSGYQDVLNLTEALAIALTSFGQGAIDESYPLVLPMEWKLLEPNWFPHYIGEMTTVWQLPSGRPMPDYIEQIMPPGESFTLQPVDEYDVVTP